MADPTIAVPVTSPVAQERPVAPTRDTVVEDMKAPTALETAAAMWRRDTVLGAALAEFSMAEDTGEFDPGFNPYSHFAANKVRMVDLEPWLRRGAFDYAKNEADFGRIAARIRTQTEDLKTIEQGSGWGLALGMGLSLVDVMTLVPFAKAGTGGAVANALRVGASGAAIATVQESALHALQPTRTETESFLNIGLTTALAGGIGVFASALHPAAPLNPANKPALDPSAPPPIGSALPGMAREEADTVGSVGAASARVTAGTEPVTGTNALQRGALKVGQWLSAVTPTGRATAWTSQVARSVTQGLFDLGGIFTRHMEEGVAHRAGAEDIMRDLMGARDEIQQSLIDGFRQMQVDMGVTGSTAAATIKSDVNLMGSIVGQKKFLNTGISEDEFHEIVRRKVTNTWWQQGGLWKIAEPDGKWFAKITEGLDPKAVEVIERHTDRVAKLLQAKALEQEEAMFRAGMITEKQRLGKKYGLAQLWDKGHVQLNKQELRGLLLQVFEGRPDEAWLLETHNLKLDEWKALPDRAQPKLDASGKPVKDAAGNTVTQPGRLDLLEEWTGDRAAVALERARAAHEAATQRYLDSLDIKELTDLGVKLGEQDLRKARMGELRAAIRQRTAELEVKRLEGLKAAALEAEGKLDEITRTIDDQTRLAEEATARRAKMGNDLAPLGDLIAAAKATKAEASDVLSSLPRDRQVSPDSLANLQKTREEYAAALAKARQQYNDAVLALRQRVKDMQLNAKWVDEAVKRVDEAKTAKALGEGSEAINIIVERESAALKKLTDKFEAVAKVRKEAWEAYKVLRTGAKEAKISVRDAKKGLTAANKEQAKAARQAAIMDTVEEIVDGIGDNGKAPNGLLRELGQSGRAKDRRIILTDDERRMFEDRGFLHKDLTYVLDRQYRDISARLALREVYGEESLEKTLKSVYADYEKLAAASPEKRAKLMAEYAAVEKDVMMGRDRMLGIAGRPEDPESLAMWGLSKLRQMTYLRFAAGFVVSSIVDLATQVLHNGFGKETLSASRRYFKVLKDAKVDPESRELRTLMLAAEMSMAHSTASRQFMLNEMASARGVGTEGSVKQAVTGTYDRVANTLQSRMNAWTLMGPYNSFVKGVSGLMFVEKLSKSLAKYDSLSTLKKAELASLGIGKEEATKLQAMFEKHGTRDDYGFHANAYKWNETAGGDEAARTLRVALRRLMDRSSPTPGIGDLPNFMSRPLGQVLAQFQSYGFGAVNRVLLPALQRGLIYGDARVAAYFTELVALSTLVATIRAYQNRKDPADYTSMQWMKEVVDRGGLTYYLSPYIDAGLKATGMDPGGMSTKYRNNKWWHSLLGPSLGTLDTIGVAGTAALNGDAQRAREKALMLVPFNQVWRLGNALANPPD